MKVKVKGVIYDVPESLIVRGQTYIEQNSECTPLMLVDHILQVNYDGVVDSPDAIKFRKANNLTDDTVISAITLALVVKLLDVEVI